MNNLVVQAAIQAENADEHRLLLVDSRFAGRARHFPAGDGPDDRVHEADHRWTAARDPAPHDVGPTGGSRYRRRYHGAGPILLRDHRPPRRVRHLRTHDVRTDPCRHPRSEHRVNRHRSTHRIQSDELLVAGGCDRLRDFVPFEERSAPGSRDRHHGPGLDLLRDEHHGRCHVAAPFGGRVHRRDGSYGEPFAGHRRRRRFHRPRSIVGRNHRHRHCPRPAGSDHARFRDCPHPGCQHRNLGDGTPRGHRQTS